MENNIKFPVSVDCNSVDPGLKIDVDNSQLPAQHGTDVEYSCPRDTDLLVGNVKTVCTNRKIILYPENISPCKEISM